MGIETTTLLAIAAIAGTATTVYSVIQQGKTEEAVAEANEAAARQQAAQQKDAAVAQAEKIRKAAAQQRSRANAALAASGVSVGEGTPVKINDTINLNAENDAYTAILNGTRAANASLNQAAIFDAQGRDAINSGYLNAGASLLAGGSRIGKNWITSAGGGGGINTGGTADFRLPNSFRLAGDLED